MPTYIGGIRVIPSSEVLRFHAQTPAHHQQPYSTTANLHHRNTASMDMMVNALQRACNQAHRPYCAFKATVERIDRHGTTNPQSRPLAA